TLVVRQPPDVGAAFQVVVHAAEIFGRIAVRNQSSPRADQQRQVFDAHRTLILAGAAGRALPEHLLRVDLSELALPLTREQRLLRLQDDGFRIELLPRAPRRAVHLTAAALDARERVEHNLAAEILHRLEADLFLLEIEIRQITELR